MHILLYSLLMGAQLTAAHILSRFCSLSPTDFTMLRFVLTGLIATVILLFMLSPSNRKNHKPLDYAIVAIAAVFWVAGIYMLIKGYTLYGISSITLISNVMTTLMGLAIGYFVFKERFTGTQLIGAGLMLGGMIIFALV